MKRIALCAFAAALATLASAGESAAPPSLTAAQILEKNAQARGGLDAWRKIDTMVWAGHVESANAQAAKLPFMLEQKRPNKTRFEIVGEQQKSLRVFDGSNGWKMRLTSAGKPEVQPYSVDETNFARDAQVIDGPLIDAAAKGIAVSLAGVDELDGRKAYRLEVKMPSGLRERVWVDAESFLDVKWQRDGRTAAGRPVTVSMHYRNYHDFAGLQIPLIIETDTAAGRVGDRLVIEKVALNPPLPDRQFEKPGVPGLRRKGVTVDTRVPPAGQSSRPAP
jgi:outer membrane lipoprotein-sorting protein